MYAINLLIVECYEKLHIWAPCALPWFPYVHWQFNLDCKVHHIFNPRTPPNWRTRTFIIIFDLLVIHISQWPPLQLYEWFHFFIRIASSANGASTSPSKYGEDYQSKRSKTSDSADPVKLCPCIGEFVNPGICVVRTLQLFDVRTHT